MKVSIEVIGVDMDSVAEALNRVADTMQKHVNNEEWVVSSCGGRATAYAQREVVIGLIESDSEALLSL